MSDNLEKEFEEERRLEAVDSFLNFIIGIGYICPLIYAFVLSLDSGEFLGLEFPGLSLLLWIWTAFFVGAIGITLIVFSLMGMVWIYRVINSMGYKAKFSFISMVSISSLVFGNLLILWAVLLSSWIQESHSSISSNLSQEIISILCFISYVFISGNSFILITRIFIMPFRSTRHARNISEFMKEEKDA